MQYICMCSVVCIGHAVKVQEHLFNRLDSHGYCCNVVVCALAVEKIETIKDSLTCYTLAHLLVCCII